MSDKLFHKTLNVNAHESALSASLLYFSTDDCYCIFVQMIAGTGTGGLLSIQPRGPPATILRQLCDNPQSRISFRQFKSSVFLSGIMKQKRKKVSSSSPGKLEQSRSISPLRMAWTKTS